MAGRRDESRAADARVAPEGVRDLARDLAARVSWERETGVAGYPPATANPVAVGELSEPPGFALEPKPSSLPDARPDPRAALLELRAEIGDCTRCPLAEGRTELVFGEGSPDARLVFVGEGPGRDEDLSGRPFVGAAGQLLDRIITAIGLRREDVYICNVVKCRPPGNRDPKPEESEVCGRFVRRQIAIVQPDVVVALGKPSAQFLLSTDRPISKLRGRFHDLDGVAVMPTYHPAYLLRNESAKRPVWEDMKQVRDRLGLTSPPG
jgi:DNA polymerase